MIKPITITYQLNRQEYLIAVYNLQGQWEEAKMSKNSYDSHPLILIYWMAVAIRKTNQDFDKKNAMTAFKRTNNKRIHLIDRDTKSL